MQPQWHAANTQTHPHNHLHCSLKKKTNNINSTLKDMKWTNQQPVESEEKEKERKQKWKALNTSFALLTQAWFSGRCVPTASQELCDRCAAYCGQHGQTRSEQGERKMSESTENSQVVVENSTQNVEILTMAAVKKSKPCKGPSWWGPTAWCSPSCP